MRWRKGSGWMLMGLLGAVGPGCVSPGPEVVIAQAVEAARDQDRDALLACFTPRSRPIIETFWERADRHNPSLGLLGAGDVEVVGVQIISSRDFMPERALIQIREGGEDGRIYAHRLGGMWRIDLLDTERAMYGFAGDP